MRVLIALSFLSVVSGEYFEGYRLDAPLLEILKGVGLRSCCKECSAYTNCQSVNYNKDDFSCELNYHHVSGLPGKSALNESVYMDRVHCFTLASCSANFCNLTCKTNEKCVLTATHQATCIISECDPVDVIPDIIPINMSRLVGTRRSLQCSTQPYPSRQRVTCDTDGQWVRQYDSCKCFSGTYWGGGSTCIECPAGQHLPYDDAAGNASCIDCPAGSYTPGPGYADCLACRPGYYSPKTESTSCKECPAGSYTPTPGYDHCIECPAGYFSRNKDPIPALCVLPVPTHLVRDIVLVFYVQPDISHQFRDLTPALNALRDIAHQIQDMSPASNALLDITHQNQDAIALALRVPLDRTKARLDKIVVFFVQQEVIANLKHL